MPEFRIFFEHSTNEDQKTFSIWQNAHLYHSSASFELVETAKPELRCDDYIVLDANYGLKLRDSKGFVREGTHKFKRLELKTRTQVDVNGGEAWNKEELGKKPLKFFDSPSELDAFVVSATQNAGCKHLVQPPLTYVRVDKERRAYVIGTATVEQADFYLLSILGKPSTKKTHEIEQKQQTEQQQQEQQCSVSLLATNSTDHTTATTSATISTTSTATSTATMTLPATASTATTPSSPSDPLSPWLNRRFRSIAFEKFYDVNAVLSVVEAVRRTLKPGQLLFVGGYAGFLAHLYGRSDDTARSFDISRPCSLF